MLIRIVANSAFSLRGPARLRPAADGVIGYFEMYDLSHEISKPAAFANWKKQMERFKVPCNMRSRKQFR